MIVYQGAPQVTEGNQSKTTVDDQNSSILLTDILKELKKANIHNSFITDEFIENTEVEV